MGFKLATIVLTVLLGTETLVIVMYRRTANRFRPVEGYSGLVAFDTASGQLCKSIATKSAAAIAQQARAEEARLQAEAAKQTEVGREKARQTSDPIEAAIDELPVSADTSREDTKAATEEFVANLPACKNVR